jgi:hypothetical protein
LNFNTAYNLHMDGKTERNKQTIEDMLRMYVMDKPGKWKEYLYLVEIAYNNNYQSSTKHSPFEILYGIKCNIPVSWSNLVNRLMIGSNMFKYMELIVKHVQQVLKVAHDRNKSYVDAKRTPREFVVGDHVYIRV